MDRPSSVLEVGDACFGQASTFFTLSTHLHLIASALQGRQRFSNASMQSLQGCVCSTDLVRMLVGELLAALKLLVLALEQAQFLGANVCRFEQALNLLRGLAQIAWGDTARLYDEVEFWYPGQEWSKPTCFSFRKSSTPEGFRILISRNQGQYGT